MNTVIFLMTLLIVTTDAEGNKGYEIVTGEYKTQHECAEAVDHEVGQRLDILTSFQAYCEKDF